MITINDFPVRHVSTCIGYLQVIIRRNDFLVDILFA
jgi:hypothetical protein